MGGGPRLPGHHGLEAEPAARARRRGRSRGGRAGDRPLADALAIGRRVRSRRPSLEQVEQDGTPEHRLVGPEDAEPPDVRPQVVAQDLPDRAGLLDECRVGGDRRVGRLRIDPKTGLSTGKDKLLTLPGRKILGLTFDPEATASDLIAWITYDAFLHSRIAYGWKGRRSAYFAVIAFLFVIFTYLGVSYLLPGLHSYA